MKNNTEHYFSENPSSNIEFYKFIFNNKLYWSASGLFSKDKIDRATELLIKAINKELKILSKNKDNYLNNKLFLDLGCGYGIVGCEIKRSFKELDVYMSDINKRAIALAKINSKELNIKVIQSDLFNNINLSFDFIAVNPPQAKGKDFIKKLIIESKKHLKKHGILFMVFSKKKGGNFIKEILNEVLNNSKILTYNSEFFVIKAIK